MTVMRKDKFAKCLTCQNRDETKSNKNWNVCTANPPSIVLINGSDDCPKFKQKKESQ